MTLKPWCALALLVSACAPAPDESSKDHPRIITRTSLPPSPFPAPPSAVPPPSPSAAPSSAPPGPPPGIPSEFNAYAEELKKACPIEEGNGSTMAMVGGEIASLNCVAELIDKEAKKLPGSRRGALIDGDPRGPHSAAMKSRISLFSTTVDAYCRVEGAQVWMQGGRRLAGTMEQNRAVFCLMGPDDALGFMMRSSNLGHPKAVVEYVRFTAESRPHPRPRLAIWRRYAEVARKTAPNLVESDCRYTCRWSDVEWLTFENDLDLAEQGAAKLASALCTDWPELSLAFGDQPTCETELGEFLLPSGSREESTDPAADAAADPISLDDPPPADARFDEATLKMRRGWVVQGNAAAGVTKYLEEIENAPSVRAKPDLVAWMGKYDSFRDRLMAMDGAAQFLAVSSDADAWLAAPPKGGSPNPKLLEGYLLREIDKGDKDALTEHVGGRQAWGEAAEKNLKELIALLERPCSPQGLRDCAGANPAKQKEAAKKVGAILEEGKALGRDLCSASPELGQALGSSCAEQTTHYLFASTEYAGRTDMLPK